MTRRIMIVEDEAPLAQHLRYRLEVEGYQVEAVDSGDEAEELIGIVVPDLAVIDSSLPGLSGVELCRRLRIQPMTELLPVIMLIAQDEVECLRGHLVGADDYIVKPFTASDLLPRVRALLRGSKPGHTAAALRSAELELNRNSHRVYRDAREVKLRPTEFRLLEFLMQSPDQVFTRQELKDGVWGREVYIDERTIDIHVGRLRKALNNGRKRDLIRTVRGIGYAFEGFG